MVQTACNSRQPSCALVRRYGAFAVAMVLSLASAIPIVFVCRLPECSRLGRAAAS